MNRDHGMHKPNNFYGDPYEIIDHVWLCQTGSDSFFGEQIMESCDDYDWSEDLLIGRIDAPSYLPAGACGYFSDFLGQGIEQIVINRP